MSQHSLLPSAVHSGPEVEPLAKRMNFGLSPATQKQSPNEGLHRDSLLKYGKMLVVIGIPYY